MRWHAFPNPVNEKAARIVAGLVVITVLGAFVLDVFTGLGAPVLWLVAAGFLLRVLAGPRFSPFGLLATKVLAPRFGEPRITAGPPKQFAQGIGLVVSLTAAILLTLGLHTAAWIVAGILVVAASLESVAGFCLGCAIFGWLQQRGVVPEGVCAECNDIWARLPKEQRPAHARDL